MSGTLDRHMQAHFKLFAVIDQHPVEFPEAELDSHLDLYREIHPIEGALLLSGPRQPYFVIRDEMSPLIGRFCFDSIVALLEREQETYVYVFFNCGSLCVFVASYRTITLLSDDDQEKMPTLRCPRDQLLPALYRCGIRYLAVLQRLVDAGRDDAPSLQQLRGKAEQARTALAARNLLDPTS